MTDADQPSLAGIPKPGEILAGKYRVEEVLGIGGMGAVVAATHLQLEERVAIKFLHAASAQNVDSVARFLREGKAVIKIRSEHAVKVHDVGKLESGAPYLVMEHLDGDDLNTLLDRHGPMATTDAIDFVLQACEAVAEAHTLGIIHRDLKPANLFLTRRADGSPCVKVLDFGISKASKPGTDDGMTKTQAVMGSPRYMSPEQMRSTRAVDLRTDVWSIGIIVYELVTGRPPFNAESMTELCAQILQDTAEPLPQVIPRLPAALDAVVQQCLAKDPEQRFASLAPLGMALAPFGTASARASAERVVRMMQARDGKALRAPPTPIPASPRAPASPLSPSAVQSLGTDPTAVSVSSQPVPSAKVAFGSTGPKSARPVVQSRLGIVSIVVTLALLLGTLLLLRSRAAASSAPAATPVPVSVSVPVPTPARSLQPAAAIPISTPVQPPTPTAPPAPIPKLSSAPPPRKRPPSAAAAASGMFDGRK